VSQNDVRPLVVEGYWLKLRHEGPESTNCHDATSRDYHTWLAASASDNRAHSLIAEIMSRVVARTPDWGTERQILALAGQHVRLSGWLMVDQEHPEQMGKTRGTLWRLILTPVVYSIVRRLDLDPLPYMFACTFIADTASLTLPVSNPINIVIGEHFGVTTADFLHYLLLPSLAAIALNVAVFLVVFRRRITGHFDPALLTDRPSPAPDPRFFRVTAAVLLLLAVAFVVGGIARVPAGVIALVGAALVVAGGNILRALDPRRVARDFSWSLFPFVAGLFIVVQGVERRGLTTPVGHLLHAARGNPLVTALLSTGISALGTNLINNVPMALVLLSAIGSVQGATGRALVYGALLGCDLGPNLTTTGSLSTMLWLLLLRQRGLEVSSLQYLRLGVSVTPVMLIVTACIVGVTV